MVDSPRADPALGVREMLDAAACHVVGGIGGSRRSAATRICAGGPKGLKKAFMDR